MKRKRRAGSKAGIPGLSWLVLAESDDFITRNLIDNTYYWIKTRKVGRGFQKPLVIDNTIILRLLTKYIIETDKPNIKKCSGLLMKHPVTRKFLERYGDDEHVLREFRLHLQRYLSLFHPDCGFEVNVTNRYRSRSGSEEACIVARKDYDEGEEIRYLTGSFAELLPEDELSLDQNDFSVINISSRELPCLMLGPSRFVNHNCSGNARFGAGGKGMKIIAVRKILTGEEITVTYSPNYFGRDNKDCLCVTCERDHKGFFDPDRFEIPDTAPLIDVPTSEDEDDDKADVIVIDDSDNNNTKESTPMSKNGQEDTSDSDTSPELLDPREVLNWGKRLSLLRQVPLTEYQEMGLLHKIPEQAKGDLIGGRVLRSRNKIQAPSSQSNQWSILNLFPRNTCLDSLALDSEGIEKEVLKARAQNRTLHSLFASDIYPNNLMEARELKTTYDCLHCGIYFKVDIQHKVKEYCHRCCRHQRVYRLAWPYTRPIPTKTFSLLLEEKIGRASIGELAEREIIGLSRQRISPERIETCGMKRHAPEGVGALMHDRRWSPQGDVKPLSTEMFLPTRKSILDEFTSDSSEDEYHSAQDFEVASPKSSKKPKHAWSSDGSAMVKELKLIENHEKKVQSLRSKSPLSSRSPRTRSTTTLLPAAEPKDVAYSKTSTKLPVQLPSYSQTKSSQAIKLYMNRKSIVVNEQESPIEIDSESSRSDDSDDNPPTKEEILMCSSKIHLEKQIIQSKTFPTPVVTKSLTITKRKIITRSSCPDSLDQRGGSKCQGVSNRYKTFLAKNQDVVVISDSDSEDEIARILL
jgi:hypothetical protein